MASTSQWQLWSFSSKDLDLKILRWFLNHLTVLNRVPFVVRCIKAGEKLHISEMHVD